MRRHRRQRRPNLLGRGAVVYAPAPSRDATAACGAQGARSRAEVGIPAWPRGGTAGCGAQAPASSAASRRTASWLWPHRRLRRPSSPEAARQRRWPPPRTGAVVRAAAAAEPKQRGDNSEAASGLRPLRGAFIIVGWSNKALHQTALRAAGERRR